MPRLHTTVQSDREQRELSVNNDKFALLCKWIEEHIDEEIGWNQLIQRSGLEYQVIQDLFFQQHSITAMAWIRRTRDAHRRQKKPERRTLTLVHRKKMSA